MEQPADRPRLPSALSALRVVLAVFVLAWLIGPPSLRTSVPIWLPFLIALGLELYVFAGALRPDPERRLDRGPQAADRDDLGYDADADELLLVHEGGEELWLPYSGETAEEVAELIAEERERRAELADAPARVPERRSLWPPVRRLLVGAAVIGALALVVWVVETQTGWDAVGAETRGEAVQRFSDEASRIAGKPVTIVCDESGDYVGAVQHADGAAAVGDDLAYLAPERCLDLYRLAFDDDVRGSQTGRALAVLAHEAWHLRGVRDEGTTECYALQSGVELGRRLGLSERTARRLMRQQLAENELRGAGALEYVVPPECRDGGRLDLNPGSDRFP
jgi:hypothetical protein